MNREQVRKIKMLSEYSYICIRIDEKEQDILYWRDKSKNISPQYSDMPKSMNVLADKMSDIVSEIDLIEREIIKEIIKLKNIKTKIENAINRLEDNRYRNILYSKYIARKTWEQIAVDMHFDYSYVLKLHKRAIDKLKSP